MTLTTKGERRTSATCHGACGRPPVNGTHLPKAVTRRKRARRAVARMQRESRRKNR